MTRKSVIARDVKRQKMVERYAVKRAALKEAFLNPENSYEEKMAAFEKLQKLPRNSSPSRVTRRCSLTGNLMPSTENLDLVELNYVKLQCAVTFLD